jgi:mRNA-degrading endonuclease toxin of MazEF toxin-antitoxin module
VRDHNGFRKTRPVIILTPNDEIGIDQPLVVMAVTTTYPHPVPKDHVELPWNPDSRRVSTGLSRRSAAVVTWLDTAYADEVMEVIGTVPTKIINNIRERLAKLPP